MPAIWRDPKTYISSDVAIGDNVVIADHNTVREDIIQNTKPQAIIPFNYLLENQRGYTYTDNREKWGTVLSGGSGQTIIMFFYDFVNGKMVSNATIDIGYTVNAAGGGILIGDNLYVSALYDGGTQYKVFKIDVTSADFANGVALTTSVTEMFHNASAALHGKMFSDGEYLYINTDTTTNELKKYSIGASSLTYISTITLPAATSTILCVDGGGNIYATNTSESYRTDIHDNSGVYITKIVRNYVYLQNMVIEGVPYYMGGSDYSTSARSPVNTYLENL